MNRHPALTDSTALRVLLDRWVAIGWLRPIDFAVADFLDTRSPSQSLGNSPSSSSDNSPLAMIAAVLASHQAGAGHVCLDLAEVLANPDFTLRMPPAEPTGPGPLNVDTPATVFAGLDLTTWQQALAEHPAVHSLGWIDDAGDTDGRPLVLAGNDRPQLYLRRYWQVEGRVAAGLAAGGQMDIPAADAVRRVLDPLFPSRNARGDETSINWQKVACALAARQPFSIITGGPGTGKTTTVVRLLAALTSLHLDDENSALPRIALCAPTGKAAARLAESIGDKVREIASIKTEGFPDAHWSDVAAQLPDQVHTIHRLIGTRPLAARPRHHQDNPLDLDIVVVDEASMVGVELMSQLVDALPANCRLVILGDKDQLASVEAGAVLGELCHDAEQASYPAPLRAYLEVASGEPLPVGEQHSANPIHARIAILRVSYRFGADSAIGGLARAVNNGDVAAATRALGRPDVSGEAAREMAREMARETAWETAGIDWLLDDLDNYLGDYSGDRLDGHPGHDAAAAFSRRIVEGLRPWLSIIAAQPAGFDPDCPNDEAAVADLFERHNDFQVLCALRRGNSGVEGLNLRIRDRLAREDLLPRPQAGPRSGLRAGRQSGPRPASWYAGRPVIVTRNDAQLRLANGDMGLTLPTRLPDGSNSLRVVFPADPDDQRRFRWISPTRLPDAETAFALTVHKSQGSEFTQVAMVMPARPNPILTRELLYTAITRARRRFTLVSPTGNEAGGASDNATRQAQAVLASAVTSVTRRSGNLRRRLVHRLTSAAGSGAGADDPLG